MSKKSKLLINSFLYTFSSLLVNAIGFILLPVYTLFLTPEDYGITNLVNSFNGVAIFIIAFSLYSAVIRFYADYKNDLEKLKRFYGTVISFVIISGIIFLLIGLIFNNIVVALFFDGIPFYPFILIALLTLTFSSLHRVHQSILQGLQQGKKLTVINLLFFSLQVGLNLLFIVILKLGAKGVLLSTLIINISYSVYMMIDLKNSNMVTFCLDINLLKESLKYSIPLMPHNLSTNIANFASRIFINNNASLASVGLYSVAYQFGTIIDVVQSSVNNAFAPWFYEMMNNCDDNSKKEVVSLSHFLLMVYSLIYMGIGLFSQEVIIFMTNEKYLLAWTTIPILVVAFSVKSIYYFYINILFYYKDASRKIFVATITGSLSDILISFLLIPKYGMYGASISFLIAKIIVVSIVVVMSEKYNDIGYKVIDMIKIIIPSLLFMGVGLYFSYTKYSNIFSFNNFLYKLIILLFYLIYLYVANRKTIKLISNSEKISYLLKKKCR